MPTDCLRKRGSGRKAFAPLKEMCETPTFMQSFPQRMWGGGHTGSTVTSGTCLSNTRLLHISQMLPGVFPWALNREQCRRGNAAEEAVWRGGYRWWLPAASQQSPQPGSQPCAKYISVVRRRGHATSNRHSFIQLLLNAKDLLCAGHHVIEPGLQIWTDGNPYTHRGSLHFSWAGRNK